MANLYGNLMSECDFDNIRERDFSLIAEVEDVRPDPMFGHVFLDNIDLQDEQEAQRFDCIEDDLTWDIFEDSLKVGSQRYEDWASWTPIRRMMLRNFIGAIRTCASIRGLYALKAEAIRSANLIDEEARFVTPTSLGMVKAEWENRKAYLQAREKRNAELRKAYEQAQDAPCAWRKGTALKLERPSRAGGLIAQGFKRVVVPTVGVKEH